VYKRQDAKDASYQFFASRSKSEIASFLIPVAGRYWVFHVASTPSFVKSHSRNSLFFAVLSGSLITAIVAVLVVIAVGIVRAEVVRSHMERHSLRIRHEAANLAHQTLISFIVHEQRNPLHLAAGSISLMQESVDNARFRVLSALK